MKNNIQSVTTNYKYYINLTNDNNTTRCIENLKLNINNIIDCSINDKNQLVITTGEKMITGFVKKEVIKNYDNIVYDDMEKFIHDYYSQVTFSIVKSMYNSNKSLNYNAVASIVENGWNDSILDDLKQCVMITLWDNLKNEKIYSFEFLKDDLASVTFWDNTKSDFIQVDNISMWLACYRSVSHYLYNTKTKDTFIRHQKTIIDENGNKTKIQWQSPRKIALETYDTNNKDENPTLYTVDTYQYREYLTNEYNTKATTKEVIAIWDIIDNVLLHIQTHEKTKVYNGCKAIINGLLNNDRLKDISKNNNISTTTITKYYNIIKDTYYTLYKKPIPYNDSTTTATTTTATAKISIDFIGCKIVNHNNDILLDKVNKYYHEKKQLMYNELFIAYNPLSIATDNTTHIRLSNTEKIYQKELWIDRQ